MARSPVPTLVLAVIGVLFSAGFIGLAVSNPTGWAHADPKDEAYNLLVQGFQSGHLHLNKEVPPGLMALPDPYDPAANVQFRHPPYELHNLSYYQGKLYLYFGVVPALVLLWPWAALTGHYLFHREAAAIFCSVGLLASLGLLRGLWRRYFPQVGGSVMAILAIALGLLAGSPILLQQADLCEVPIACGYALTMLALGAVWFALHDEARSGRWLGAASLAMGLSVGARPTLLFGAVILLIPLIWGPAKTRIWRLLPFAFGPIALCGIGLMAYNQKRFGSPFDFGQLYQLAVDYQGAVPHFSLSYLWFNLCVDFLEPVRWGAHFPFVGKIVTPALPTNHGWVEDAYGVLTNLPILCWALAVPVALRNRGAGERSLLRAAILGAALLFAGSAVVLGLFYWNASRYEMDFLPGLAILAVVGVLGLERAWAGQPLYLWVSRFAWGLSLASSCTFVVFNCVEHYAEERAQVGFNLQEAGQHSAAVPQFEAAIRAGYITPEIDNFLGNDMLQGNQEAKAAAYYEDAVRRDPNFAAAHYNFANLLGHQGRFREAEAQYRETLRLMPDNPDIHENLAIILVRLGRAQEAGFEHQQALRLRGATR